MPAEYRSNRCINIVRKKVTWYEANDECQAIKGTLAVTDSKEKIRNVSVLAETQKQDGVNLWVGLTKSVWRQTPGRLFTLAIQYDSRIVLNYMYLGHGQINGIKRSITSGGKTILKVNGMSIGPTK